MFIYYMYEFILMSVNTCSVISLFRIQFDDSIASSMFLQTLYLNQTASFINKTEIQEKTNHSSETHSK